MMRRAIVDVYEGDFLALGSGLYRGSGGSHGVANIQAETERQAEQFALELFDGVGGDRAVFRCWTDDLPASGRADGVLLAVVVCIGAAVVLLCAMAVDRWLL